PSILSTCAVWSGLDKYRDLLTTKRYFDYSSIHEIAVEQLLNNDALRARVKERVRHLIVDEYQDVNPVQEALIGAFRDLGISVCVVGDDDQTIYQWRGSDVRNLLTFPTRYPKAIQIRLEENFRSSTGIVESARAFIAQNNPSRLDKVMRSTGAHADEPGDL